MPLLLRSYDHGVTPWRYASVVWNACTDQPVRWARSQDLEQIPFGSDLTVAEQQRVDDLPHFLHPDETSLDQG